MVKAWAMVSTSAEVVKAWAKALISAEVVSAAWAVAVKGKLNYRSRTLDSRVTSKSPTSKQAETKTGRAFTFSKPLTKVWDQDLLIRARLRSKQGKISANTTKT